MSLFEWITNFSHSFRQGGISMLFCHLVWTEKLKQKTSIYRRYRNDLGSLSGTPVS